MQALDQASAQALITQLEQQQQAQIQCLQALFGLSSEDNVKRPEATDEAKDTCTHIASLQNAIRLLHTPVADGLSGTNEDCMLSSNNAGSTPPPSAPQETIPDEPLSQNAIHMPDDWALPWSNVLLRERIEEREREPGCEGGLARRKYP